MAGPTVSYTNSFRKQREKRLSDLFKKKIVVKNLPAKAGDTRDAGLILGSRGSPGEGHDNPLQYSCLENPMDRGAWWATVHRID